MTESLCSISCRFFGGVSCITAPRIRTFVPMPVTVPDGFIASGTSEPSISPVYSDQLPLTAMRTLFGGTQMPLLGQRIALAQRQTQQEMTSQAEGAAEGT